MARSEALEKALNETVDRQNTSFLDAARSAGYAEGVEDLSSVFLRKGIYSTFVELHIEQGPIRAEEGISIGIVTAIAALSSIEVDFEGNVGHAGAVLMPIDLLTGSEGNELGLLHTLFSSWADYTNCYRSVKTFQPNN